MEEKRKFEKFLIEDCFQLSLNYLGKKILYPLNCDLKYDRYENPEELTGKSNSLKLHSSNGAVLDLTYEVFFDEPLRIEVWFTNGSYNQRYQTIHLDTEEVLYGTRYYLMCSCGSRSVQPYI